MTSAQLASLQALILSQPTNGAVLAARAAGNDTGVASLLNDRSDPTRTVMTSMTMRDFSNFLVSRGLLSKIRNNQTNSVAQIADICLLLMYKVQGDPLTIIDPNDQQQMGMVEALVQATIATSDDVTAWQAACKVQASLAEKQAIVTYPTDVTANDVAAADGRI